MKYIESTILKSKHGFFTRHGGVSEGYLKSLNFNQAADRQENISHNHNLVAKHFGVENCYLVKQVHGDQVFYLQGRASTANIEADALITTQRNVLIGVKTADCVPILLESEDGKVIAAIHAGWRGALSGVIDSTISMMSELTELNLKAAIGPAIALHSYEVDQNFYNNFVSDLGAQIADQFFETKTSNRLLFDLPGFCQYKLSILGVSEVEDLAIDTVTNPQDFFSYRRKTLLLEPSYGCQFSGIMIS